MSKAPIRVRFAPSPTGHLHIGGLRTALFNWLFARHNNGSYLVRIEDTDKERSKPEYTQAILDALQWTNLESDEPLVYQSEYIQTHQDLIEKLLAEGKAYKCYCPNEATEDNFIMYEGACRIVTDGDKDAPYVVRLRLPDQETITVDDIIRGPITFQMKQFDDFIIARSDGTPVYNFVVVVDDAAMKISHVIRGEDHISNTPKQMMLYEALGYSLPKFAHLPLILNEAGGRLSKRDAATSVLDYKKSGYLPEALCNYLVRLGWSHGDQELFSREELIKLFTLEGVGKKGSVFDIQKLNWLNATYLQAMTPQELRDYIVAEYDANFNDRFADWSLEQQLDLIGLYTSRVNTIAELLEELDLVYRGPESFDSALVEEHTSAATREHLAGVVEQLQRLNEYSPDAIKGALKLFTKEKGIKLGAIAQPIRIALVGKTSSPGVFELVAGLPRDVVIDRLERLSDNLMNL